MLLRFLGAFMYTQLNSYSFVDNYTLAGLAALLPRSTARYARQTTLITLPNAPCPVPIKRLCNRVVQLTANRSEWGQSEKVIAALVAREIEGMHQSSYWEYVEGLPCCISWICKLPISFLCCDCTPSSVVETINLGQELSSELLAEDPHIFDAAE